MFLYINIQVLKVMKYSIYSCHNNNYKQLKLSIKQQNKNMEALVEKKLKQNFVPQGAIIKPLMERRYL